MVWRKRHTSPQRSSLCGTLQIQAWHQEIWPDWNEGANGVNKHEGFKAMPRDQRSVRDRLNKLLADFNAKMRKEEGESGTNPGPLSEAETILEEIEEKNSVSKG